MTTSPTNEHMEILKIQIMVMRATFEMIKTLRPQPHLVMMHTGVTLEDLDHELTKIEKKVGLK